HEWSIILPPVQQASGHTIFAAQMREQTFQPKRQRRSEFHRDLGNRMDEDETGSVEGHAGQGNRRPGLAAAIRLVADDGMAPRCQMDANLMRPTGLQPALDVRERAKSLANPEPGDRAPSRTVPSDGHALAMVGITTDGRVDSPFAGG